MHILSIRCIVYAHASFACRLEWDVKVRQGREVDEFDRFGPTYILAVTPISQVVGCARLLPDGPMMLSKLIPDLEPSGQLRPHVAMIESSRFCVDTSLEQGRGGRFLHHFCRMVCQGATRPKGKGTNPAAIAVPLPDCAAATTRPLQTLPEGEAKACRTVGRFRQSLVLALVA